MLDCIIKNGSVIDGTGAPRVPADVGIADGKVVSVGKIADTARRVIDAEGRVVAPGFIDIHTHIDAQIMWEPALTPSSTHGVTTVIGGNCGFAIAPVDETSADYILRMLSSVEGIPVEALFAGLKLGWRSYADWTSRLEGNVALNCGFLAGHSTVRRLVMGDDWRRPATEAEVEKMAELVSQCVDEGAIGFSSSYNEIHIDHRGEPVPSRFAEPDELIRLAGVLRDKPGTVLGFQAGSWPYFSDKSIKVMADMSVAAGGKRLNWNALTVGTGVSEDAIRKRLTASAYAKERGGNVYALMFPGVQKPYIVPETVIFFGMLPVWSEVFALPHAERVKALNDPEVRKKLADVLASQEGELRTILQVDKMSVVTVISPELKHLEGRSLEDIAREQGKTPLDVFFDLCVSEDLKACFVCGGGGDDDEHWKLRQEFWNDERTIVGASDTGAHLDALDTFKFVTDFVGPTVRDRKLLSLEEAVFRLTDELAQFYGLKGRGRIAPGYQADIVIFDPDTVASGPTRLQADLPGGGARLYGEPVGIDRVMVNGVEVVVDGKPTGATPGTVLKSGIDTYPTV